MLLELERHDSEYDPPEKVWIIAFHLWNIILDDLLVTLKQDSITWGIADILIAYWIMRIMRIFTLLLSQQPNKVFALTKTNSLYKNISIHLFKLTYPNFNEESA